MPCQEAPPQPSSIPTGASSRPLLSYFTRKNTRPVAESHLTLYLCPLFVFFTMSMGYF